MEKMEFNRTRLKKAKKKKLEHIYDKKPLVEFIAAALSIPSIILLLVLNFKTLTAYNNAKPTPTPQNTSGSTGFFARPVIHQIQPTTDSANQTPCIKSLGPVTITSPNEGDTVTSNPVEVDISYDEGTYCSAVWSYRINGGAWSDYNNNSVALYNLPNGPITFDLRAKSLVNANQSTQTRNFIYEGSTTASGSAH